jgi:hypothetical protein
LAEIICLHCLKLPETAAREMLDFVEFLEQRYGSGPLTKEEADDTEAFLVALTGSLGDDFPGDIMDGDPGPGAPA